MDARSAGITDGCENEKSTGAGEFLDGEAPGGRNLLNLSTYSEFYYTAHSRFLKMSRRRPLRVLLLARCLSAMVVPRELLDKQDVIIGHDGAVQPAEGRAPTVKRAARAPLHTSFVESPQTPALQGTARRISSLAAPALQPSSVAHDSEATQHDKTAAPDDDFSV